jgi:thioredoxin 2
MHRVVPLVDQLGWRRCRSRLIFDVGFMNNIELDERGLLLPCPQCGKRNRLNYERLEQSFRCGHCHTELRLPGQSLHVKSEAQFDALTRRSTLPVLVDFWAEWCGPCKMAAPEFDKVAAEGAGQWLVAKINVDEVPELAQSFRVSSIPTLVLFHAGREVARKAGAMPAKAIRQFIQQNQSANGS